MSQIWHTQSWTPVTPKLLLSQHVPSCQWHSINPVAQTKCLNLSMTLFFLSHLTFNLKRKILLALQSKCMLSLPPLSISATYATEQAIIFSLVCCNTLLHGFPTSLVVSFRWESTFLNNLYLISLLVSMASYHIAKKTQIPFHGVQGPAWLTTAHLSDKVSYHFSLYWLNSSCSWGHQIHSCLRTLELVNHWAWKMLHPDTHLYHYLT